MGRPNYLSSTTRQKILMFNKAIMFTVFTCIVHHNLLRDFSFQVQTVCHTDKVSICMILHDLCIECYLFYHHCLYPKIAMSNFLGLLWVILTYHTTPESFHLVTSMSHSYESSKNFKPVAHGGAIALSVVFILSTQITLSQMRASSVNSILWRSLASAVVMDGESGDAVTSVKAVP